MADDDGPTSRSGLRRAVPEDRVAKWVMGALGTLVLLAVPTLIVTWAKVRELPSATELVLLQARVQQIATDKARDDAQDKAIAEMKQEARDRATTWWCRYSWTKDSIYDLQVATHVQRTTPPCNRND